MAFASQDFDFTCSHHLILSFQTGSFSHRTSPCYCWNDGATLRIPQTNCSPIHGTHRQGCCFCCCPCTSCIRVHLVIKTRSVDHSKYHRSRTSGHHGWNRIVRAWAWKEHQRQGVIFVAELKQRYAEWYFRIYSVVLKNIYTRYKFIFYLS